MTASLAGVHSNPNRLDTFTVSLVSVHSDPNRLDYTNRDSWLVLDAMTASLAGGHCNSSRLVPTPHLAIARAKEYTLPTTTNS